MERLLSIFQRGGDEASLPNIAARLLQLRHALGALGGYQEGLLTNSLVKHTLGQSVGYLSEAIAISRRDGFSGKERALAKEILTHVNTASQKILAVVENNVEE